MTVRELYEQRATILEKQKGIHAKAVEENRSMNEEENTEYDKYDKDYFDLTKRIEQAEAIAQKDAESARVNGLLLTDKRKDPNDPKELIELRKQSFKNFIQGFVSDEDVRLLCKGDPRYEGRVQNVGTTTAGGFLVPEGYSNELAVARAAFGGMRQAARVILTATGNPMPWPVIDDTANVGQTESESGDLTAGTTDLVFAEKTLNAYKMHSDMLKVSEELLQDSYFSMQDLMTDLLGERVGRKENALFTTGSGSSTPNGVVTAATEGVQSASTSTVTRANIVDLMHSVDPYYRQSPKCFWMFNDTYLATIKKIDIGSSDSRGLWEPSLVPGAPDLIEGKPYIINQSMADPASASKSILFGDFSKFVIRDSGMPRFRRLNELFAANDQVAFVILVRIDSELVAADAPIKYIQQATT